MLLKWPSLSYTWMMVPLQKNYLRNSDTILEVISDTAVRMELVTL